MRKLSTTILALLLLLPAVSARALLVDPATQPAGAVTGRVLGEDEKPVSKATVMLVPVPDQKGPIRPAERAATDKEGRFRVALPAGKYLLRAATADAVTSKAIEVEPGNDVTARVRKDAVPRLEGRVTDANGKPIAQARVVIAVEFVAGSDAFSRLSSQRLGPSVTDADGRYRVPASFPDLRYRVLVDRKGYGGEMSAVVAAMKPGEVRAVPEVALNKADRFVSGRVVDDAGRPVAKARVSVVRAVAPPHAVTDDHGDFRIEGVADPEFELSVQGYELSPEHPRMKADTGNHVLVVHRAAPASK